jgi:hypothetical protein
MSCYYISSNNKYIGFFEMIVNRLQELKNDLHCQIIMKEICGRRYAAVICDACRLDSVKTLIKDIMKDIILINYKHLFFKKSLNINISDKSLESLFYTSIILYDRDYDSDILNIEKLVGGELSIDGILQFCTKDLHSRWLNVSEILRENFYSDSDREAIYEFVKHIIYSIPCKMNEVNIYKSGRGYKFIDKEGKSIGEFLGSGGELASEIIFLSPAMINFCTSCDRQTMILLKNIFNDRIKFY